jgi:hypothetical protein
MTRYLYLLLALLCTESTQGFVGSQNRAKTGAFLRDKIVTAVYSSKENENDDIISPLQASDLGEYDRSRGVTPKRQVNVGDPQIKVQEKERSVTSILKELAAIQQQGPQKYCILGTRHCSFLHQQIIELL